MMWVNMIYSMEVEPIFQWMVQILIFSEWVNPSHKNE